MMIWLIIGFVAGLILGVCWIFLWALGEVADMEDEWIRDREW